MSRVLHISSLEQSILSVTSKYTNKGLVILFGSQATGKADKNSDIDLAIDTGSMLSVTEKMSLIAELASLLGRPVDLVDLNVVGEPLLGQILKYGKRISGSDKSYGNLMSKHVFDQADFMPYRNRILAQRRQAWIGK